MAELAALIAAIARHQELVVAFSGGADSAFLARVAHDTLGRGRVRAVTAVSPSLAADELDDCRGLAAAWGLRWSTVATDEMERAAYRVNDGDRCYHCKSALMDALDPLRGDGVTIALGVNTDDLGDHRPGQRAAGERAAVFPLVEAGFSKADVRTGRSGSACGRGTSRRPPAWPRGCRTAPRSRWRCCRRWSGLRPACGRWGSARSGCVTTSARLASSCRCEDSGGARAAVAGGRRRARGRL